MSILGVHIDGGLMGLFLDHFCVLEVNIRAALNVMESQK